jgi:replication factor C large subunit
MTAKPLPWTTVYAPKQTSDIQGQQAVISQIEQFLKVRKPGTVCLLYGQQGIGKTSMVHAIAAGTDAELLEVNASDVRNESSITELLGPALKQQSLFSRTKIILFDEVDGLSGSNDRGGLGAILRLAKESPFPIIMTANDPWDAKFAELRKQAVMVQARALAYTSIVPVIKRIADAQKLSYTDDSLKMLARRAGGDLRAAITDLQTLAPDITPERVESLSERNATESIVNAVRIVLKTKDPVLARKILDTIDEDIDEIFMWMDENLPKEYKKPADVERAYDLLSQADVFRGRIRRWQHWRFLVYCYDLLGPGIALSKAEKYEGFTQLQATTRIFALWRAKSAKRDSVVSKLAKEQHTSKKVARTEMRILQRVLGEAPFLSDEDRDWLSARP